MPRTMMKRRVAVAAGLTLLVLGSLHFYLLDGIDGLLWSWAFADDTQYTARYSDWKFRRVGKAMSEQEVRDLIGDPFTEVWWYEGDYKVMFEGDSVVATYGARARSGPVKEDMSRASVLEIAGAPLRKRWIFTRSAHGDSYRTRIVEFTGLRVTEKIHDFYID